MNEIWIFALAWMSLWVFGFGSRFFGAYLWRRSLVAFTVQFPRGLAGDQVSAFLAVLRTATASKGRFGFRSCAPVVVETVANVAGIGHMLLVPSFLVTTVQASAQAALPGVRLEEDARYLATRPRLKRAVELRLTNSRRPLAADRTQAANAAFLAALQPLPVGANIRVQWVFYGARTPAPIRTPKKDRNPLLPWWLDNTAPADADDIRAQRAKDKDPLLHVIARVGVFGVNRRTATGLLGRVWGPLRVLNAPGAHIVRRWWIPSVLTKRRARRATIPIGKWPLLLNTREAAGVIGIPLGELFLPGLSLAGCRQLPAPVSMPRTGAVLATSNYPGSLSRPLALKKADRLRHTWMIGPTGVGKTTALTNMCGQDIAAGDSALVIDPRGDYTHDVLNRIPEHRWDDVVILDPAHTERPVGFNILNFGGGEHERELVVDHVVHVFSDLFRSSWGPRTADVLRAGLLTLTSSKAPDGSRFTLCELPELLTNPALRRYVLKQKSIAAGVRPFWAWYENLSDAEQAQVIGPVLNKLRAFTLKTSLRLMLGQPDGLDLGTLFRERRIVLVPLSRGIIGAEAAQLVGALLLSSFWQTTLKQQHIPATKRRPVWAYIDEFQDVLRLPLDMADMLAQARSLGVGLTLAHQHLGQLPDSVKTAVRSTARTHITFQLGYDDAKDLARFFAPLTPPELMGLARYEIAMKPCLDNQVLSPVTGITAPLPEPTTDGAELAAASFQRYGVPRVDVEAGLAARINVSGEIQIGRSARGGETDD